MTGVSAQLHNEQLVMLISFPCKCKTQQSRHYVFSNTGSKHQMMVNDSDSRKVCHFVFQNCQHVGFKKNPLCRLKLKSSHLLLVEQCKKYMPNCWTTRGPNAVFMAQISILLSFCLRPAERGMTWLQQQLIRHCLHTGTQTACVCGRQRDDITQLRYKTM